MLGVPLEKFFIQSEVNRIHWAFRNQTDIMQQQLVSCFTHLV